MANYIVEVGWENNTDFDGLYDDITEDVKSIHFSRGKSGELGKAEVGQLSIVLKNGTGTYTPSNSSSVLYGNLLPKRPIRIRAIQQLVTISVTKSLAAAGDYDAEDVLSESAGAGTAWTFSDISKIKGGFGYITKAQAICETTGLTPRLTLYLFSATLTCNLNDNVANTGLLHADLANYVGKIDFPPMNDLGGDSEALVTPGINLPLAFNCASDSTSLYGVLVTKDAITGETATMDMTINLTVELPQYDLFYGFIEEIIPHPHLTEQDCIITAIDGLDFLSRHDMATALYKNAKTGTIHSYILDDAGWNLDMRKLDDGQDTIPYWYGSDVMSRFAQGEMDDYEQGFSFVDGAGNFRFEDRNHRLLNDHLVSQGTFDNTMSNMTYSLNPKNIYNTIKAAARPRTLQPIAELWKLQETPSIASGATSTYWGEASVNGIPVFVDAWTTPVAAAGTNDIGSAAIDRAYGLVSTNTIIDLTNPIGVAGEIASIEIWAAVYITGLRVGTFYLVSGTTYKCRDSETIGNVTAGSKQTFVVSLDAQVGDFIGCYYDTGDIDFDLSGGSGIMNVAGEFIDPDDETVYSVVDADGSMSLFGLVIGDYTANSLANGTGDDETANIAITASKFAKTIKLEVTNNAGHLVYMTLLKARGTWYLEETTVTCKAEDTTSQTAYQKRTLTLDSKYITEISKAQDFCDTALAQYKDPHAELTMTIMNQDANTFTQILSREISDRITIINDILGIGSIDVGSTAINRASAGGALYTYIDLANPINETGVITNIKIWANHHLEGLRIGIFYLSSGTIYVCRSTYTIGNVPSGSEQTFTVSLHAYAGDFIGCYFTHGQIDVDASGGTGVMSYFGDAIDSGDSATYTANNGYAMSLYGYGTGGWEYIIDYMEHDISEGGLLHTATYKLVTS